MNYTDCLSDLQDGENGGFPGTDCTGCGDYNNCFRTFNLRVDHSDRRSIGVDPENGYMHTTNLGRENRSNAQLRR